MKKILAISASAVMAFSLLAFTACDKNTDKGLEDLTYTDVDLSSEQKKEEFLEEVSTNIDFSKIFGDTTAEGYTFGLAADLNLGAKVSVTAKGFGENGADLTVSADVEVGESLKIKTSAESTLLSSTSTVKYSTSIPNDVYDLLGEIGAPVETLKTVLPSGNYTLSEYMDGEYVYIDCPKNIIELLPEGTLPESGKIKLPLGGYEDDYEQDFVVSGYAVVDDDYDYEEDYEVDVVGNMLALLESCNVKISVSKENGYALKLTADKDAVINVIVATTPLTKEALGEIATFNTCALSLYFGVDENGVFKGATVKADVDVKITLAEGTFDDMVEGLPAFEGTVKLNLDLDVKKYDGEVSLPSDLNSYVELSFSDDDEE